ncbi:EscU/YscU/HrcU family type III secretion system export apparatus switch protein [Croceibacterium ferulae]|uniref:EscU/YscU/HrcU family type III secretion system export apparatus switch protein n=1 Tax=Croceibacterium ferulae TaxID=1854641 RepID=UPI000EB32F16|nr:flagellar type III secretion system protein FlhB [Croceibacterium ferulae]
MSETAGEKSFAPTEKRLRDAANKGDVLRSKELATAGVILLAAAWLSFAGPWLLQSLGALMRTALMFDRGQVDDFSPARLMTRALWAGLPLVASIALPVIGVTLITQLGLGSGRWVGGNMAWKGSRIDPLAGLKRMFGMQGLIELAKGLGKVALLGAIAFAWARSWLDTIVGLGRSTLAGQLDAGWGALLSLLLTLGGGLVVIALADVPIQWIRRNGRLKMSMQELRDENKESEGSPEAKSARRQRQREIARGAVAPAMRDAQFVLTNPTHFAVAMTYDPQRAAAPIVLAKGRGDKAAAMKELAREMAVPLLEYPQLARSVFYTTRENQTIREELYGALAAVLAYVFSLRRGEQRSLPPVDVPVALRFDADGKLAS